MNDAARVHVLQRLGHLIDDKSDMYILQDAFGDDIVQISLHELEHQIHVFIVLCPDSVVEYDDIRML